MVAYGVNRCAVHFQGGKYIGLHLLSVDGVDHHRDAQRLMLVQFVGKSDHVAGDVHVRFGKIVPQVSQFGIGVYGGAHIGRRGVEESVHTLVIGQEGLTINLGSHPLANDGGLYFFLRGSAHLLHSESGGVLAAVFLLAQGGPYHFAFAQGGNFPPFTVLLGAFAGILPAGAEQVPCYEVLGVLIILLLPDALLVLEIKYEGAVILELPAVLLAVVVFRLVADHTAFPQAIDVFAVVHIQFLVADHGLFRPDHTAVFPDGYVALAYHGGARDGIDVEFNLHRLTRFRTTGQGHIIADNGYIGLFPIGPRGSICCILGE